MSTITISEDRFNQILIDVEKLVNDVSQLFSQEKTVKKRLAEIQADPSIGKSEKELDAYLKKRGVKID